MKVFETELAGVVELAPAVFSDDRGYFLETFNLERYREALGPHAAAELAAVVQFNHSHSTRATLRGLHFQEPRAQGKLVWTARGSVFDVAVDVRRGSPGFGRWVGRELSEANHRQLWVPPGYAHGFCVLSEVADFMYACTGYYAPDCEHSLRWDDPDLAIEWPIAEPILSDKDASAPFLADAPVLPGYRD